MKKYILLALISYTSFAFGQSDNNFQKLHFNKQYSDITIQKNENKVFNFEMVKDNYYNFIIKNIDIDIEIEYFDSYGKSILKDHSYGIGDQSNINYACKKSGLYKIVVKPSEKIDNASKGFFTILLSKSNKQLTKYKHSALILDFEILKNAYYETNVGLWYNSRTQFDSICNVQRSKIKNDMNALDFYQIVAPIVSFTKEGHCKIAYSDEINLFSKKNFKYLPLIIKIIDFKVYILNDIGDKKTRGMLVSKINGIEADTIMKLFLSIHPSDGYNLTGKLHRIERRFSQYFASFINNQSASFNLEIANPTSNGVTKLDNLSTLNYEDFIRLQNETIDKIPNHSFKEVSTFNMDKENKTATIVFNDFSSNRYKDGRKGFQNLLESYFNSIAENKVENLIIDLRKNEGGDQGIEDELLSYLVSKEYIKYKYVEIPSFDFTFLNYTTYSTKPQQAELENNLRKEFYQATDGRYLNKKEFYKDEKPKKNNFKGKIFILINGLTFSGASEFAALAKNYTNAQFIGEETGGGYYGNTSGTFLNFTLPNTGLKGRVPICKFVIEPKENNIPMGRGVLPDYKIQPSITDYLNNIDTEMLYIKKIIDK